MKKITQISIVTLAASSMLLAGATFAAAQSDTGTMQASVTGAAAVGSTMESHINNNGTVLVRGAKITSISGNTINATQTWGSYSVSWVVNTNSTTQLFRRFGAASAVSEFSVGDYISFSGPIDTTKSVATVNAKVVKDYSIQKKNATFSGTVSSVNSANSSFVLATRERGNITVVVSSTTKVLNGSATTTFASLAVGQTISRASGVWDTVSSTLAAQEVKIDVDQHLLDKRTFEGALGTLSSTSTPTSFSYVVGGKAFTVKITTATQILSKGWNQIQLSKFTAGDTIRVYGAIEANSTSTINAYIVRDTSVK